MRRITPQNALKLSAWIAHQHPDFFRVLIGKVNALQRSPAGKLGLFGDDSGLDTITVTADAAPTPDFSTLDVSTPDITLTDVGIGSALDTGIDTSGSDAITQAIAAPATPDSASPPVSSSFWSSVSGGVSSAVSSIGQVASALVNPQTLGAAATAAGAYFASQAKTAQAQAQAQTQQAILQSQLSRVALGAAPAPISYTRNPVTGQLIPVYNSTTGTLPVTPRLLNQLSSPSVAGVSPTLLIGGGIAALILISLVFAKR